MLAIEQDMGEQRAQKIANQIKQPLMKHSIVQIRSVGIFKEALAITLLLATAAGVYAAVGDEIQLGARNATGLNPYYTESGVFADSSAQSAVGYSIGSRYGSTYTSIVGLKQGIFSIDTPEAGFYDVDVTWGNGANRRANIFCEVTYLGGATTSTLIDQSATFDTWVNIGTGLQFDAGTGMGQVLIDNSQANLSGSFYVDSVRLTLVQAIPEPSAIALSLLGGLGLLWNVRRRTA